MTSAYRFPGPVHRPDNQSGNSSWGIEGERARGVHSAQPMNESEDQHGYKTRYSLPMHGMQHTHLQRIAVVFNMQEQPPESKGRSEMHDRWMHECYSQPRRSLH